MNNVERMLKLADSGTSTFTASGPQSDEFVLCEQHVTLLDELHAIEADVRARLGVLEHLGRRLLPPFLERAHLEWAELWADLELEPLYAQHLAYDGWSGKVHVMRRPYQKRAGCHETRAVCGRLDRGRRLVALTRPALRGSWGTGARCERCERKASAAQFPELTETLNSVWLDDIARELVAATAAGVFAQLMLDHMRRAGDTQRTPADCAEQPAVWSMLGAPSPSVSERVQGVCERAARTAYAQLTADEYSRRGDSALLPLIGADEQAVLLACEHQDSARLVDLLDAEKLVWLSMPAFRDSRFAREHRAKLRRGAFIVGSGVHVRHQLARTFPERVADCVRAAARAPAAAAEARARQAVADAEARDRASQQSLDRYAERQLTLRRLSRP